MTSCGHSCTFSLEQAVWLKLLLRTPVLVASTIVLRSRCSPIQSLSISTKPKKFQRTYSKYSHTHTRPKRDGTACMGILDWPLWLVWWIPDVEHFSRGHCRNLVEWGWKHRLRRVSAVTFAAETFHWDLPRLRLSLLGGQLLALYTIKEICLRPCAGSCWYQISAAILGGKIVRDMHDVEIEYRTCGWSTLIRRQIRSGDGIIM